MGSARVSRAGFGVSPKQSFRYTRAIADLQPRKMELVSQGDTSRWNPYRKDMLPHVLDAPKRVPPFILPISSTSPNREREHCAGRLGFQPDRHLPGQIRLEMKGRQ